MKSNKPLWKSQNKSEINTNKQKTKHIKKINHKKSTKNNQQLNEINIQPKKHQKNHTIQTAGKDKKQKHPLTPKKQHLNKKNININ